jgi:hypothetical protein
MGGFSSVEEASPKRSLCFPRGGPSLSPGRTKDWKDMLGVSIELGFILLMEDLGTYREKRLSLKLQSQAVHIFEQGIVLSQAHCIHLIFK